jgi:hypothetical protein
MRRRLALSFVSVSALVGFGLQPRIADAAPSQWVVTPSPNDTQGAVLNVVSCTSPDSCMAVGFGANGSTDDTLTEAWNGSSWSITPSPSPGTFANYLYGVSCIGANFCMAVGYYYTETSGPISLAETWDGTSWSLTTVPAKGKGGNNLEAVSCTSADFCVAVGGYSSTSDVGGTLVETWDGTSWSVTRSPSDAYLQGVSCTSQTDCVAVGSYYNASDTQLNFIATWNGTTWSDTTVADKGAGSNYLTGVSCSSANSCMAVGIYRTGPDHTYQTLAEVWNGTTWSISPSPDVGTGDNYLTAVSCTGSTDCVGVGYEGPLAQTLVEIWTGTTWSIVPSPSPGDEVNNLFGTSCASITNCVTAGEYYSQSTPPSTLVESGSFPPPSMTSFSPSSGSVETVVTIHGTNLQDATAVKFNGTAATIKKDSATKIKVTVPTGATSGQIEVTDPGGTVTSSSSFTVT